MARKLKTQFSKDILLQAANLYDCPIEAIKHVGGFENEIYGFKRQSKEYILRIGHSEHRLFADVEGEMDFIDYLYKNAAHVSLPIKSINHRLAEIIPVNKHDYFIVSAFEKAKGEHVRKETLSDEVYFHIGKTIGQFHRLAKDYQPNKKIKKRMNWDEDSLALDASKILSSEDDGILQAFKEVIQQIEAIPKTKDNYGIMHGDVHFGNFFISDDQLTVFDFDDVMYFYYASDIAICLFYYVMNAIGEDRIVKTNNFLKHFLQGYQEEHALDTDTFIKLDLFLKFREIILYLVIHQNVTEGFDAWSQRYITMYRPRILENKRFVDIDYNQYIKKGDL